MASLIFVSLSFTIGFEGLQIIGNTKKIIHKENLLTFSSVLGTICILIWIFSYIRFGFDLTDESHYYLWISKPFRYGVSSSQFGYFYNLIFRLLGENISLLRCFNILFTFGLSMTLIVVFLKKTFVSIRRFEIIAISSAISLSSLIHLKNWILIPSYNTLTLQGLLIGSLGILVCKKRIGFGGLLIGCGIWLSFLGKPTSAFLLGLMCLFYLITSKVNRKVFLSAFCYSSILLVLSAFYIDGSIGDFVSRLRNEVLFQGIFNVRHDFLSILRFDKLIFKNKDLLIIFSLIILNLFIPFFYKFTRIRYLFAFITAGIIFTLIVYPEFIVPSLNKSKIRLLVYAMPLSHLISSLLIFRPFRFRSDKSQFWLFSLFCLSMPYVYVFGTGRNYWAAGTEAGFFIILSSLTFISSFQLEERTLKFALLSCGFFAQLLLTICTSFGMMHPYRQKQPIFLNDAEVRIDKSTVVLPKESQKYFEVAKNSLQGTGFMPNMPIIDLTGRSPGLLLALNFHILGRPWFPGGYPGSSDFAIQFLLQEQCSKLGSAWLLVEPRGRRKLDPSILQKFGAHFDLDYSKVSSFDTPKGTSGFVESNEQILYKPKRNIKQAKLACEEKRVTITR